MANYVPAEAADILRFITFVRPQPNGCWNARKLHCIRSHSFDEINTRIDPKTGARVCRKCTNMRAKESYQRGKLRTA